MQRLKPAPRAFLVTTALPYANGPLHLGHILEAIQADIWVRFQKLKGHDCVLIGGDDAHGTSIMLSAEKKGVTPEILINEILAEHKIDLKDFLIDFDNYYTTHSPENFELVKEIYYRLCKKGDIFSKTISQAFDPVKNIFLPDRFIHGECPRCHTKNQYGDNCEHCGAIYTPADLINPQSVLSGATPIKRESQHFFFALDHYHSFLKTWISKNQLQPAVLHKLEEWFQQGLKPWDISRDAPYFGFALPDHPNKYFYVWVDAPIGYMASFKNLTRREKSLNFEAYWQPDSTKELHHFIGKDIMYFHGLFWPALLKSSNFRLPTGLHVHGYLTIDGLKMSKSRGTFITARNYLTKLHPEYLRYYLAAKLNDSVDDIDFNRTDFKQRVNADLVGKYINIASRCASFITRYFEGRLGDTLLEPQLFEYFIEKSNEISNNLENLNYHKAIRQIMNLADQTNHYIDQAKPWELIKTNKEKLKVQGICTLSLNLFKTLSIYLKPILPSTAEKIEHFLNIPPLTWQNLDQPLLAQPISPFEPLLQRVEDVLL